ncbi:MAG: hypothetical protein M3P04_09625, partial [Actinomycetota bacterium]|nr:hypothetical protein [Actinomycetota bacterium]
MELYDVVLFAHISVVLCAIALASAIHVSEWLVPRATTVEELRVVTRPQMWGVGFAPIVALLLLLGMWLVKLSEDERQDYSFSDGWVWTAIIVLAWLFLTGFLIEGRHAEHLGKELAAAPNGPPTADIKALVGSRLPWVLG